MGGPGAVWSLYVVAVVCNVASAENVQISTAYGMLRGLRTPLGDSYVDQYLGVPFAAPPVDDLRFRPPQAPEPWHGVRDATSVSPQCPQRPPSALFMPMQNISSNEDCLYLNVFTPKPPADGSRLPVMFWIHGGAYHSGTANGYDGTYLAAKGVVVVGTNYRIDALGFLSTEDAASPGNYGLLDQIEALKWVRDTISAFNGDPDDVTIFGESAGSASVSLLVLSRLTQGLFHKAIMESGVSLSPWAVGFPNLDPKPRLQAETLASMVGCSGRDSAQMVACLRTVDADVIIDAAENISFTALQAVAFRPVVEPMFGQTGVLAASPEVLLQNGWTNNVTVMAGYTKNEGALGYQDLDPRMFLPDVFRNETLPGFVQFMFRQTSSSVDLDRIASLLLDAYVTGPGLTNWEDIRQAYVQISTDYTFRAPTTRQLKLASGSMPSASRYLYRLSYRPPNRLAHEWQGVMHGDDIPFVFGAPVSGQMPWHGFVSSWTDEDKRVSDVIMTLWTNFAKYGNPTPEGVSGAPTWQPWTTDAPAFLDISSTLSMVDDPETKQIRVWDDIEKLRKGIATIDIIG